MLLYHFPLTSNSATPNLENKGLKSDYVLGGQGQFVSGGKLSSYAYNIDGINQSFVFNEINKLDSYTICFRFKYNSTRNVYNTLFWNRNDSDIHTDYIQFPGNSTRASIVCHGNTTAYYYFDKDTWYDVIFIYNKSKGRAYYINGDCVVGNDRVEKCLFCSIGARSIEHTNYTPINIQDIRIYDHVLSQQEIKDYSKALVLHYPLNGSELGNTIKDVSGFGNDLFLQENSRGFKYINGGVMGMRYADCEDEALRVYYSTKTNPYPNDNTTISFWIKSNVLNNNAITLIRKFNNGSYINGTNGSIYAYVQTSQGNASSWISNSNTSNWKHVAFTFEQKGAKVITKSYLNGVLSLTRTLDGVISTSEQLCEIVKNTNSRDTFSFSDFRIYATALSESDIKALYNSPINFDKTSMNAIELSENAKYKSFAWRTPTSDEINYIINRRPNASSLKGLGRVLVNGAYINGCFILPDGFILPKGISFTPTIANFTTNSYTLEQLRKLESVCAIFLCCGGYSVGTNVINVNIGGDYSTSTAKDINTMYQLYFETSAINIGDGGKRGRFSIRLIRNSQQGKFSTPTGNIDFAPANLQYHCTKHIWRFAENQYDYIGAANANISDSYNGWIDLFGYGTSGKNYSPTLHSTNNSDYASGDISGTENDWGINEITTLEHEEKNIKLYKSGVITANEISEGDTNEFTANSIQVTKLKED
ncbi:MAG: LamG domain-containing protein [Bacteroidales bacterium]|nr:LamG domain-containing protein [Bacteroidales bacterium]